MAAKPPTTCSNCGSSDIRTAMIPTHVQLYAGVWRYMCDECGFAGAVFDDAKKHDSGKADKKLRDPQPTATVNAIREAVGKPPLTGGQP